MGDERRDFDTPGRTNGQQDQTEPVPPQDETQPFAAPGETEPEPRPAAAPDETQPMAAPGETRPAAAPDETQPMAAPDETQPFAPPPGERDKTQPFAPPPGERDKTQPFAPPPGERDKTAMMPRDSGAWSGRAGVAPPPGPSLRDSAPYTQQIPQAEQPRPWWTPLLLGLLALGLLGVLILVAWWMGRDESPAPVEPPTASAIVPTLSAEPETQAPTAPASPTAQTVQIPRLVGLQVDKAVAQLDQLGLGYRFEYRQADDPEGTVIAASPPEGQVVPVQVTVTLTISTGRDRSPSPSPSRPLASASPNR